MFPLLGLGTAFQRFFLKLMRAAAEKAAIIPFWLQLQLC